MKIANAKARKKEASNIVLVQGGLSEVSTRPPSIPA